MARSTFSDDLQATVLRYRLACDRKLDRIG
jgi:hypothetical protein